MESLLLNVESPILNVDCCSPRTEAVEENDNNTDEEIESNVNEAEKNVSKAANTVNELSEIISKTEECAFMAIGTQSVNWAKKNWGRMIPKGEADSIIAYCDEFFSRGSPDPDAVIIEALKRCLDADARNMNYLRRVLTDWREDGVLTVNQVESREAERKSQKDHKRGNKDPGDKPPRPPKTSSKYEKFYL